VGKQVEEGTIDEVVAANVSRLRDKATLSVQQLADRLDVSRHLVYDMEGNRSGRAQRSFTLGDLVRLCDALDANLFELVLPPEGVRLRLIESHGAVKGGGLWSVRLVDRDEYSSLLFGGPVAEGEYLESLRRVASTRRERLEEKRAEIEQGLAELLASLEDE
jgi:transcriptional regulator with XRE-family HTH domain